MLGELSNQLANYTEKKLAFWDSRDLFDETRPSTLRRINLDLDVSDPKYNGVKTSRRQLVQDDGDDIDDEDDDDEDQYASSSQHDAATAKISRTVVDDSSSASEEGDGTPSGERSTSNEPQRSLPPNTLQEQDLTSALQASRLADREKGKAISRQLVSHV